MNRSLMRISRKFAGMVAAVAILATPMIGLARSTTYAVELDAELDALPKLTSSQCSGLLKYQSKGDCVKELQTRLNNYGAKVGVDGDFGTATVLAVTRFQFIRDGLDADGVVGDKTKAALYGPQVEAPKPKKLKGAEFRKEVVRVAAHAVSKNMEYSWGGGHDDPPGLSLGHCNHYTGTPPCKAPYLASFDCSGLAAYATYMAGHAVMGVTSEQIEKGKKISKSQAEPGDLVFFYKKGTHDVVHVGIYAGDDMMYEAPGSHQNLRKGSIKGRDIAGFVRYNA